MESKSLIIKSYVEGVHFQVVKIVWIYLCVINRPGTMSKTNVFK
jgi:hypothetical protein